MDKKLNITGFIALFYLGGILFSIGSIITFIGLVNGKENYNFIIALCVTLFCFAVIAVLRLLEEIYKSLNK